MLVISTTISGCALANSQDAAEKMNDSSGNEILGEKVLVLCDYISIFSVCKLHTCTKCDAECTLVSNEEPDKIQQITKELLYLDKVKQDTIKNGITDACSTAVCCQCKQHKWRHLEAKFETNASSATWWPKLKIIQVKSTLN